MAQNHDEAMILPTLGIQVGLRDLFRLAFLGLLWWFLSTLSPEPGNPKLDCPGLGFRVQGLGFRV